jgi:hypothetical protein
MRKASRVFSAIAGFAILMGCGSDCGNVEAQYSEIEVRCAAAETLIGPGDWYVTYLQNGKQFLIMHKVISDDGKTMRQTITGIGPQGKPGEQIQVLDRQ